MNILDRADRILTWIEKAVVVLLLGSMTLLAFLQVVLRNLFQFGFLWADPLLRYMVVWVGFTGAALAAREEKHFGIEFLNRFLRPKPLHLVRTIISGFAAVIAFLLMRAAIQFLMEGFSAGETDLFDLPKRLYFAVIPAGFGLVAIHFAIHFIRHLRGIFSGEPDPSEPVSSQGIV